ncbi:MAG: type VI secretion system-associated protein TagF [Hellea sp.]|nr:type VI secretion system-associated protein TagF [Hellea sp.]
MSHIAIKMPAFHGKLPAHGDFISRGLDTPSLNSIDIWLSDIMARARKIWGELFSSNYRMAQPWLFSGKKAVAVLMPSLDKVGRLFPLLTMASPGTLLQQLYDLVHKAIAESWVCDKLDSELGKLETAHANDQVQGWFLPQSDHLALPHPMEGITPKIGGLLG